MRRDPGRDGHPVLSRHDRQWSLRIPLSSRGRRSLATEVLTYSADYAGQYRREIRAHFERALSFDHMAECLDETYTLVCGTAERRAVELVAP